MFRIASKENCILIVVLLALCAVSFYDVVFLGKTFKVTTANAQALPTGVYAQEANKPAFIPVNGTDSPVLEEPLYQFIKRQFERGRLPLWNPHQACGYPLIGMLQVGIFFPLHFILYIFPEIISWDLLILSRFFFSALFTYWMMRHFGFNMICSLSSAIMFMLSGPVVLLQYWTFNVELVMPLLIIAIDKLVKKPSPQNTAFVALSTSLTFFAGHPEHVFFVNAFAFGFLCFRVFTNKKTQPITPLIRPLLTAYILGIGLSSIVFFPFIRNFLSEFWHGHPPGVGLLMEEQRGRALTLAVPHFFQTVPLTYKFTFAGWWGGYLGTLPLALTFVSLFNKHKKGLNYFFATSAFLLLSKAYGLPFINWIGHLPLFNACRYAIHTPHIVAFCVSVSAGMGVRTVLSNKNVFKKALPFALALLSIILLHFLFLQKTLDRPVAIKATIFAGVILSAFLAILFLKDKKIITRKVTGCLLVGIIFFELFAYIHRERPTRFESFGRVPYIEFLKKQPDKIRAYGTFWSFYPNTATGFGVDDLGIFLGFLPKRFVSFVNAMIYPDLIINDLRPPALRSLPVQQRTYICDLLNIKYIVSPSADRMKTLLLDFDVEKERALAAYDGEVLIHERKKAFPRAFIVHKAIFEPDEKKSLEILKQLRPQLGFLAIINHAPIDTIKQELKELPTRDRSQAKITTYIPNRVRIKAFMQNPGFLILSDAYHPDWDVYVNGRISRIYRADYLLRAVYLPRGTHTVTFVFRPRSFYFGALMSIICLAVVTYLLRKKATNND